MSPGKSRSSRSGVAEARIALTMESRLNGQSPGSTKERGAAAGDLVSRVISVTASSRNSQGTSGN